MAGYPSTSFGCCGPCDPTPCVPAGVTPDPVITPPGQLFSGSLLITITDSLPGAVIYYTLDGSTPTVASTLYTGPFSITDSEIVSAIAYSAGNANSNVVSETYLSGILTVATPVIAPPSQSFATTISVSITCATVGATIYYTTDGSNPTTGSPVYTAPFILSATMTVKAFAVKPASLDSATATNIYTKVVGGTTVRWGWSSNLTLNEAQILAFSDFASTPDQFAVYPYSAATVNDYAFIWWPDSFPSVTANPNGFIYFGFGLAMAGAPEGFPNGPDSGYTWLAVTVNSVPGRLYRSFYQIGSGSSQNITVQ